MSFILRWGGGGGPCFSEFGVKRGPDFKDLTPELELGEGAGWAVPPLAFKENRAKFGPKIFACLLLK